MSVLGPLGLCLPLILGSQEGPLANGAFQPVAERAWELLAAGDTLLADLQEEGVDPGRLGRVFDSWQQALAASEPGDAVPGEGALDEALAARCALGVEEAVLRRLEGLTAPDREAFRTRFEPLAAASGGSACERLYPGTRAAAEAALRLGDEAAELGWEQRASTWWQRSARHARLSGLDELAAAAERRQGWIDRAAPEAPDPLRGATSLGVSSSHAIEGFLVRPDALRRVPLGRGMRLGAAALGDGRLLVQGPRRGLLYDGAALRGGARPRMVDFEALVDRDFRTLSPFAAPSAGGWSLLPSASDDALSAVVVVDRGDPSRTVGGVVTPARGNRLMALGPAPGIDGGLGVQWAREGSRALGPAAAAGELLGATPEFQPGPLQLEGLVLVTARLMGDAPARDTVRPRPQAPEGSAPGPEAGEDRGSAPLEEAPRALTGVEGDLWLLALSSSTGAVTWSRFLTRASDLSGNMPLRMRAPELRSVGMPLGLAHGRLLCCTNTGLVTAHELDGRLVWSLRTRRREASAAGWPGSRRPLETEAGALVAPGDSDHAYLVDPRPGAAPLLGQPTPLGSALDLIGPSGGRLLLMGRDGARAGLLQVDEEGRESPILNLAAGERFTGTALLTPSRLALATDRRIYLFDMEENARLLAAAGLPEDAHGGDLVAVGGQILLLGVDRASLLEIRRD
ncbi:MAG: hypothetical protein ISQ08_01620 [Planctomycetes bacterium]|nr:hypothetical protein [Planctomycetota bacterium]